MSALPNRPLTRLGRSSRPAQCAGAGGGSGARRRQQHGDGGDRRDCRHHAGARQGLATVPISFMVVGMWLGTLPVGMLAGARPPHRAADRYDIRRAVRPDLLRGGAAGLVPAFQCRRRFQRLLRRGASILSLRRRRYRERRISGRRRYPGCWPAAFCRRDRAAARHRTKDSGRPICSPRPISAQSASR